MQLQLQLGILGIDYMFIGITLQSTPIFLVTMISSIVVAVKADKIKNIYLILFITGMVASFVDFLTVPIISLGLPIIIYFLIIQKQRKITFKETIKIIIISSINWGIGYMLTWFSKWVIIDVIYNKNLISTAIEQTIYRSVSLHSEVAGYKTLYYIITITGELIKSSMLCIAIGSMAATIVRLIINRKKLKNVKEILEDVFPYLIVLIMPYVWYFILAEHTCQHYIFTYRALLLFLVSMSLIILKISEKKRNLAIEEKKK